MHELERRRRRRLVAGGNWAISDVREVDSVHFPRLPTIVAAESVAGDLEKPCTKQCAVANLRSLAVSRKHYFLCQVLRQGEVTTARTEEGNELRCKGSEQFSERILVRRLQKLLCHCLFTEGSFVCDRLVAHSRCFDH